MAALCALDTPRRVDAQAIHRRYNNTGCVGFRSESAVHLDVDLFAANSPAVRAFQMYFTELSQPQAVASPGTQPIGIVPQSPLAPLLKRRRVETLT